MGAESTQGRVAQWVISSMKPGDFKRLCAHSAISRLRYKTLLRNAALATDVD